VEPLRLRGRSRLADVEDAAGGMACPSRPDSSVVSLLLQEESKRDRARTVQGTSRAEDCPEAGAEFPVTFTFDETFEFVVVGLIVRSFGLATGVGIGILLASALFAG
jgi:hypothetical protein